MSCKVGVRFVDVVAVVTFVGLFSTVPTLIKNEGQSRRLFCRHPRAQILSNNPQGEFDTPQPVKDQVLTTVESSHPLYDLYNVKDWALERGNVRQS